MFLSFSFWVVQFLNILQLSMLLFLLSLGLSIIFGLMNFVNLAHGSFYALGSLLSYSISNFFGIYYLSYILAPLAVMFIGVFIYIVLVERLLSRGPMSQVLVTFGLIFILFDVQKYIWGSDHLGVLDFPLSFSVMIFGEHYPFYRLLIIACGFCVFFILHYLFRFSRLGIEVRAIVDNRDLASCVGVRVRFVFFVVFLLGCGLAGFAGAVALPSFSAYSGMGIEILVPALVIVVVGGLGSLGGAFVGSLLVGFTLVIGQVLFTEFAGVLMYGLVVLVLLFRPSGLLPVRV